MAYAKKLLLDIAKLGTIINHFHFAIVKTRINATILCEAIQQDRANPLK
jgi:hypothetical protein